MRENKAWVLPPAVRREISTTKEGKSWFGLPIPYDNQAPSEGRPGSSLPVVIKVIAGS